MAYWRNYVVSAVSPLLRLQPSSAQRELIALTRHLARERLAPSADRQASFPFDDYISAPTASSARACPNAAVSPSATHATRAAELMRPWTEEIATQQAWEAALGLGAQRGSAVGALSYFRRLQYTYRELSSTR